MKIFVKYLFRLLPVVLFTVAALIVYHELAAHDIHDVMKALKATPRLRMAAAAGLTLLNYLILAGYDGLALRYTGHSDISLPRVLGASLIGYGISNNSGQAWAAGGAIRYRFYAAWGIPGIDIAKISLFLGLTYLTGVTTLGFFSGLLMPADLRGAVENPQLLTLATLLCALFLLGYWALILLRRQPLRLRGVEIAVPSRSLAAVQTAVASLDMLLAAFVLWLFLMDIPGLGFEAFLLIYVIAQVVGLISQVPGGLGIFEGAFFWLTGPAVTDAHAAILSGLLLYRLIYYILPLMVAGGGLLLYEVWDNRRHLARAKNLLSRTLSLTTPQVFSVLLVLAGGVLLISGATPSLPDNMRWLERVMPLSLVELSHLTGSVAGLLLLFLARGVHLRLDAAWYGSLIVLAVGAAVSLLKGLDWQEASIMAAMFAAMLTSRRFFYRKSSLLSVSFNPSWLAMIAILLSGVVWIGFFSYKHVEYSHELWWQFSYKGDASRFLRSLVVLGGTLIGISCMKLMSVSRPHVARKTSAEELAEALPLVRQTNDSQTFLALLGDKSLFWAEDRSAFLAYAATSGYWIVMGDPIGRPDAFGELLWRFREEADRFAAKAVFYQVTEEHLPLYLDLGLILLKMGQDARVPLTEVDLSGKKRAHLRSSRNKLIRLGFRFDVLAPDAVAAAMPRLQEVSDRWLASKKTREKGFSLGFFDPEYLARTAVAVIRDPDGQIMAFANLWLPDNREEMSIDLMRYASESPNGIMDYLFAELMLWGRQQGFRWFNLGMAPLTGLERHPLAPLWHKIGTTIFDLGEEFYNFEGLYQFKAKFDPVWSARYLAVPPGLAAPSVLLKTAALVCGGWTGILSR